MSACHLRAAFIVTCAVLAGCAGGMPVKKPSMDLNKYITRPGDTVELVAYRYRLDPDELRAINNLSGGSVLQPGLRLTIGESNQVARKPLAVKRQEVVVQAPQQPQAKPEPQVKTVVMPASTRVVKKEEILESVEFEPPRVQAKKPVPVQASRNGWVWPASGSVARGFQPNVVNRQGLDITARPGEQVVAAADGTVVYSGQDLASHGKLVILRHNDDVLTAYSLAKELFVQEDEVVRAGDAIAGLGDADEQSSILHFEVRKDGKPIDPLQYLPKR